LNREEIEALLKLYEEENKSLTDELIENPTNRKNIASKLQKNQEIMNRLHKELLTNGETLYNIAFDKTKKLKKYITEEELKNIRKQIIKKDFTGVKNQIRRNSKLPQHIKEALINNLDYIEGMPKIIEKISYGDMLNSTSVKDYLNDIATYDKKLYSLLHSTNRITVNYQHNTNGKTIATIHSGIDSYLVLKLKELEKENVVENIEKINDIEQFMKNDTYLNELKINRHTSELILRNIDDLAQSRKEVTDIRRMAHRRYSSRKL